jgi:pimeloyl-ACP methyl ester carboxylesterase
VFYFQSDETADNYALRSVYRSSPVYGEPFYWLEAGREHEATVVMVHGVLAHSMAYRKVVEAFASQYRVVVPDMPGHGREQTFQSELIEPEIYDLIDWFEHLLEEIYEETGGPLYVVGHSLGALLAFVAGREQDRFVPIERLALISPGIRIGIPPWTSKIFESLPTDLARIGTTSLGLRLYEPIQWRQSRMTSEELESYLRPLQERERLEFMLDLGADLLSEPDRLPGAHRVDRPTFILTGADDHLLEVETIQLLNSVIPDSRMEVLDGVGHCPMEDRPERFTDSVLDFFGE